MVIVLLLALLLAGGAVALGMRAAVLPRLTAARRIGQIRAYGFDDVRPVAEDDERPSRRLDRLAAAIGRFVERHFGRHDLSEARNELMMAGIYDVDASTFTGYRAMSGTVVSLLMVWWSAAVAVSPILAITLVIAGAAAGWIAPLTLVRRKARQRFDEIEGGLPELVDILVVAVEAGLAFNSAMRVAAQRIPGPLGDEMRLALQEQTMGLSTTQALEHMLQRSETPSMRSFVRSVTQGETLGVSIGEILRNLAVEMRRRRRQRAEERAQKAPVKMLFPLVFLIFPSMFIVLLYPAVQQLSNGLNG